MILFLVLFLTISVLPCAADTPIPKPPAALIKGEGLFNTYCARCHGAGGKGTAQGPPFLDKVYAPDHHADVAFVRAAESGVRAHHWKFGDMPKVPDVTRNDLAQIIPYIRWLQKEAGVF
jgi:mono/diheme cytochrome c family protein